MIFRNQIAAMFALALAGLISAAPMALAQSGPLRIVIDEGVIEPMPVAVPGFIDEGGAGDYAANIAKVVAADLAGTGLFREIPADAFISRVTSFDAPVAYQDWQAINAQALVTGSVQASGVEPGWNNISTVEAVANTANSTARQAMKSESS